MPSVRRHSASAAARKPRNSPAGCSSALADKDLASAPSGERAAGRRPRCSPSARRRLPRHRQGAGVQPDGRRPRLRDPAYDRPGGHDDMPFLVDSITNEFNRREIGVHLLAHPVLAVRRDLDGRPGRDCERSGRARAGRKSMMHLEIDRLADRAQLDDLAAALSRVLAEVMDGGRGLARACGRPASMRSTTWCPVARPGWREYEDFLHWLEANHFTFLRPSPLTATSRTPASRAGYATTSCRARRSACCGGTRVRLFEAGLGGGEAYVALRARGPTTS